MKKLLTFVFAMLLGASLSLAQTGAGDTKKSDAGDKKTTTTKKAGASDKKPATGTATKKSGASTKKTATTTKKAPEGTAKKGTAKKSGKKSTPDSGTTAPK